MYNNFSNGTNFEPAVSLRRVLAILFKHKRTIVSVFVVVAGAVALITSMSGRKTEKEV
jgi:uncharacterized protein involved in exopolysaccharide biosynthesis